MKTVLKNKLESHVFNTINYFIFLSFAFICIYPFYYIFIFSLSDPQESVKGGIYLIPKGLTLFNYISVLKLKGIPGAVVVSVARSVIGTAVTVFSCSIFGYALSKKELIFRKFFYRMVVITMYLNAGLIPWYITMRAIKLQNNFLLYILPWAVSGFYLILIKTYIEQLPPSMEESAMIGGANYFIIFIKIIIPLSLPVLATVAVFSAVNQWNAWSDNFFLVRNPKLQTLQLILLTYLKQSESLARNISSMDHELLSKRATALTPIAVRMTITMVATLPIVFVYPFLQRYFVKGIMLGAVKG